MSLPWRHGKLAIVRDHGGDLHRIDLLFEQISEDHLMGEILRHLAGILGRDGSHGLAAFARVGLLGGFQQGGMAAGDSLRLLGIELGVVGRLEPRG